MILRDAIPHRFVTRQCERSTGDGRILRRRAACRGDARLRARPGSGRARGGRVPPVPLTDERRTTRTTAIMEMGGHCQNSDKRRTKRITEWIGPD
ncbi:hypothetical protein EVAR_103211_1 [Eumeta japonica]|uniref:Uncharacterized protein n=1 Tax=Eumeta variegata TaxID=151549 RepID=A0A4C1ZYG0_EUMVA|nr:hypothetical protein EVAR_103211_1 [Eumeta japonica]